MALCPRSINTGTFISTALLITEGNFVGPEEGTVVITRTSLYVACCHLRVCSLFHTERFKRYNSPFGK